MPNEGGIYRDCPVMIYDSNSGTLIIRAVITAHYMSEMVIVVSDEMKEVERGTRLSLLIIYDGGVSECNGIARGFFDGTREITLFNERQREGRSATRHVLNASAVIRSLFVDSLRHPYQPPLEVVIENISSSGALIVTAVMEFDIDNVLELNTDIGGHSAALFAKVARKQVISDSVIGLGCYFIFPEQSAGE